MSGSIRTTTTAARTINGFKLVRLNRNHLDEVIQFLMKHFVPNEPLSRCKCRNSSDVSNVVEGVVRTSFEFPYSYAFKNEYDEIIAARIASITERPKSEVKKQEDVFSAIKGKDDGNGSEKMTTSAIEIVKLITALETKTWDLVAPSTKKLLAHLILSTHNKYTGRGLMRELLTFDLAQQKRDGIDGAISEATAYNSQKLFAKLGYRVLYEIRLENWLNKEGKPIFTCDDRTNCAQLVHQPY